MSDISHSLAPGKVVFIGPQAPASAAASVAKTQRQEAAADGTRVPPESAALPHPVEVSKAVSDLNAYVQSVSRELHFSVDENSGRTIITVMDPETDEIIRQIPPEEVLALAEFLDRGDELPRQGFLMRGKA